MQQDQLRETATPVSALDALFDSIAATSDLTDEHIMLLMYIVGQQEDIATTSVLGALRILDNPGSGWSPEVLGERSTK
ncbi:hypothetical protein BGZ97_005151 [Linnemannia gamsii]|uniref:Uncharacterized protein n=1 Tax=Linnemannia gamsii TaxID=64522 RepID=A0A9P6USP9_9FUNG|nr:hypothetical protein BGZ97_005151 [Linnemannia gamsii]